MSPHNTHKKCRKSAAKQHLTRRQIGSQTNLNQQDRAAGIRKKPYTPHFQASIRLETSFNCSEKGMLEISFPRTNPASERSS
jgi:hypothetical protein